MSAQGDKFRNRPEEDLTTRRTAEDEIMRGDRGVGRTGDGSSGGSGTAGGGMENEGTGSLLVDDAGEAESEGEQDKQSQPGDAASDEGKGSGSTKGGNAPGVSGKRGVSGGTEKEGEGHSGPIRSDSGSSEQDRAATDNEDDNAREGYEDQGGSRDDDGSRGESSGSRPGYR